MDRRQFLTAGSAAAAGPALAPAVARGQRQLAVASGFPPDWLEPGAAGALLAGRLNRLGHPAAVRAGRDLPGTADLPAGGQPARWAEAAWRALARDEVDAVVTVPGLALGAGEPATAELLAGPPFALEAAELAAWQAGEEAQELAGAVYGDAGLHAVPLGSFASSTGFWFRGPPPTETLSGWRIAARGLAAQVFGEVGLQPVADSDRLTAEAVGNEVDALAGWSPSLDDVAGLPGRADGFLRAGWHRPAVTAVALMRLAPWRRLGDGDQRRVAAAVRAVGEAMGSGLMAADAHAHDSWPTSGAAAGEAAAVLSGRAEPAKKGRLYAVDWPHASLNRLGAAAGDVIAQRRTADSLSRRTIDSQLAFRGAALGFSRYHQQALYRTRLLPFPFAR